MLDKIPKNKFKPAFKFVYNKKFISNQLNGKTNYNIF